MNRGRSSICFWFCKNGNTYLNEKLRRRQRLISKPKYVAEFKCIKMKWCKLEKFFSCHAVHLGYHKPKLPTDACFQYLSRKDHVNFVSLCLLTTLHYTTLHYTTLHYSLFSSWEMWSWICLILGIKLKLSYVIYIMSSRSSLRLWKWNIYTVKL